MSRRSLRITRQKHIEEPTVNLTPLIDVVFVILIMFILIAPMLELDRVDLADAADERANAPIAVQEASKITIYVHKDNKITLNDQPVTIDQLAEQLKQAKKRHPNARPQLFHDRRGHFGVYQSVKNAAEAAGFQQMDIILKPV